MIKSRSKNTFLLQPCPRCGARMKFYPGCCGNLPLLRCPTCGHIKKWQESIPESSQYLKLK